MSNAVVKFRLEPKSGRDRILLVAMRLFGEQGFDSVTVRDIAAAADVSVGLINHHFGSKDGLRDQVDAHFLEVFEAAYLEGTRVGAEVTSAEEYSQWIEAWISRHVDDWPLLAQYLRRALLEESDWGAEVFRRYYDIVRSAIDRVDAAGGVAPEVDRLWLPFLIIYLQVGTLLLDPYIKRILGRSGFDRDLWRRRHEAYSHMLASGVWSGGAPARPSPRPTRRRRPPPEK
ncbi:MAG: TetR/AcrR family transcriptional regulator [Alphaproteobacteria bacterium]|nr:TetR/AcrR family transcriptional regulator [Alphaproteobacteria bacterium]